MELHPLPILAFLTLALVASHAARAPELYWKSMLPNVPMPKPVRDSLQPDSVENLNSGKGNPGGSTIVFVGAVSVGRIYYFEAAANENQPRDDPNAAFFFLEKDMHTGTTTMNNTFFIEYSNMATFLPRQVANSIPFSSNKLPEIFNRFSVKPGSVEAETMAKTIKDCESSWIKGEEKYCATSLESMIDFSISKLGKNLQAISTEVEKQTQRQKHTITDGIKKMSGGKTVVCHKTGYAYAVFFCHVSQSWAYMVPLEGADGTKAKAVAVCHKDTAGWSQKMLAFQVLNVKPGTIPICHYTSEDTIVWVSN